MISRQFIQSGKLFQLTSKQSLLCPLSIVGCSSSSSYIHTMSNNNPCTSLYYGSNMNNNNNNQYIIINNNKKWFLSDLSTDDILDRIKKVLGEMERAKLDVSKPLTAESHIFNDCGLDSLDFVEFGIALEDEFGIEIEDDKAEGITTVGDAIKLIQENPNAA